MHLSTILSGAPFIVQINLYSSPEGKYVGSFTITNYHLVVEENGISNTGGNYFLILDVEINPSTYLSTATSEALP